MQSGAMQKSVVALCFAFCTTLQAALPISQVVIWGHKLHSHTHSYIHEAFVRGFEAMGYKTLWLDKNDDISRLDFANTLFLTEGQVDQGMPIRADSWYILHNVESSKYKDVLSANRAILLQVYTHDVLERQVEKVSPFVYRDIPGRVFYMPWATDLLPHEIDQIKASLPTRDKTIYWIGTIGDGRFGNVHQLSGFKRAAEERGVRFEHKSSVSQEENIHLTQRSHIAPAIVGAWQLEKGYIPCRIFKTISYGQMGVTNSKAVSELFEGKIVYNENTYELFHDAEKKLESMSQSELFALMDFVRDQHTYINRIQELLKFLEAIRHESVKEEL